MRYLVTGGAGFIGSHLVERLLRNGHTVRVIDDFSTGKKENLKAFEKDIDLIEGDIRDYDKVQKAVKKIEIVLHQAALPSVPRSIQDPMATHEVNATGTLNVLQASKEEGAARVVYASSSSVYGDTPDLPKHEGMSPNPLSPYAVSKLTGEKYCQVFARVYGLETIALRYFNVFGPRQDPNSQYSAVIPKFINAMLKGERPLIFGDGEQSRDFTYVDNVVQANVLASEASGGVGQVFNCACQGRTTLNTLVGIINRVLDSNLKPLYRDARPGDIMHSFADIQKIKHLIDYEPKVDFEDGLNNTIRFYKSEFEK